MEAEPLRVGVQFCVHGRVGSGVSGGGGSGAARWWVCLGNRVVSVKGRGRCY